MQPAIKSINFLSVANQKPICDMNCVLNTVD